MKKNGDVAVSRDGILGPFRMVSIENYARSTGYPEDPVVWRSHRVKQGHQLPRDLSEAIAAQFWSTVQLGPERDQAIVALMLDVGLRVGEVARLQLSDFEASQQPSELSSLRVTGKGQRQRRVSRFFCESSTVLARRRASVLTLGFHVHNITG